MYQEGEMNPNLGGQIYVEGSQDYNHHNSASLEVDDVHNVPLNSNEEEMIAMHARQMAMNPGHVQEYENLQESNDINQDDAMRNHIFVTREYMDPNQQYQEQLGHQQMHDHLMNAYHNNHMLVQQQQQHVQYDQSHGMNSHIRNAELVHHQQHLQHQQQHQQQQQQQQQQQHHHQHHQQQQHQHHQQIQQQLQHQLIPQQQQHMRPHSLEDQQPLSAPPRKKTKTQYPWLETQGPACYSERQEQSSVDLTNISKKYKSMRCLYCFKYNPVTPWATMRPRKYEMSSLQDHANSLHHQKAEYAREKALSLNTPAAANFPSLEDHMQLAQARLDAQEAAAVAMAAGPSTMHGNSINNAGAPLPPADSPAQPPSGHPVMNAPGVNINNNSNNHSMNPSSSLAAAASASAALAASKSSNKKKRPVMELTKTHATRGTLRPSWLLTEGGLIFSERQLADPDRPATLVRKYQLMLCTACAVHSPRSPWATLKPRKFEARLLAEHEVSAHHQKSVATSNAFPGQSSLSQSLLTQTPLMVAGQNQQSNQASNQQSQQQSAQGSAQSQAQQQQVQQGQNQHGQGQSAASTLTPVDSYHRQPQLTQQQQQHHASQHSAQLQHSAQHSAQQLHAQQHQQQQAIAIQQALLQQQQQQQHHQQQQQQQHQQQQQQHLAAQQAALASQYRPVVPSVSADSLPHPQPLPAGHALQSHALSHTMNNNYHQVPLQHSHHSVVYPSNVHEYGHQQSYAGPISVHDPAYGASNLQHSHAQLIAAQSQLHYQQQQQQLLEEQDQVDPHQLEQQRFANNNNNMLYENMVYYDHLNNARDTYDPNSNNDEEEDNNDNNNNN